MILLIGGTSETATFAEALAKAGFSVLVSTATDIPLETGDHPNIARRCGRLDEEAMERFARDHGIRVIVDASHPYAVAARHNAQEVADRLNIPYLTWVRPPVLDQDASLLFADDHEQASRLAFGFARPVLLTTGARNLLPYAKESQRMGLALVVRVLPYPESLEACREAGIPDTGVIAARGPFTLEENLATIKHFDIGCVVTKDSGSAGGVHEKIEAARIAGCAVVVIRRPDKRAADTFSSSSHLIELILGYCDYK